MNLSVSKIEDLSQRVLESSAEHAKHYAGATEGRQPVSTVYVPADRFSRTTAADFGAEALRLLNLHTPGEGSFGSSFMLDPTIAGVVRARVAAKLATDPVEDIRIDFEDGYGVRSDAEEDETVAQVVEAVAASYQVQQLPHFWGLRIKSFADGGHERSMRTLDGFLTSLRDRLGRLPGGFVITFPKIVMPEHVTIFVDYLDRLETSLGLPNGTLRFEVQIETPESIINHHGEFGLRRIVQAGAGRISGAHFGVFDYTASCDLPPEEQRLDHPACDFARNVMQVSLAGTGIRLSDGSTNVVPRNDGADEITRTWQTHAQQVRHSLSNGFYQGWDLHPSHLPARYAAVYDFHLTGVDDVIGRVKAWQDQTPTADGVMDEPATVKALTARLRRGIECGALDPNVLP